MIICANIGKAKFELIASGNGWQFTIENNKRRGTFWFFVDWDSTVNWFYVFVLGKRRWFRREGWRITTHK